MAALSSTGAVVEIADAAQWVRKSPSPCMRRPVWDGFWEMDSRRRTRLANAFPGIGAERRYCAPGLTQLEYPAVGARAVPYADVIGAIVLVRGGSKPGGRHILRRPDLRRYSNSVTDVFLGARGRGSRLCDAIHLLLAR